MPDIFHAVARCRWCGGRFTKELAQWRCESDACYARQTAQAVARLISLPGRSPYLFLPLPLQVDIADHPAKRLLVHGAAGISKSYGGRWYAYQQARLIPGMQILLLRCTYDQLEKNHLQFMDAEAKLLGDAEFKSGNPKRMLFENTSQVRMGYCQDEGDISQHLGNEWDLIIMEEAVNFLPRAIREITARDRGSATAREAREALGMMTGRSRLLTNPGGRAMAELRAFYIDHDPDLEQYPHYDPQFYGEISGSVVDNPYLSENYLAETLGGHTKERYAQLATGSWDAFENQFFANFHKDLHVHALEPD